jgi:type IV pilus assembly protein PilA
MDRHQPAGFTLIELLIVVALIGILASLAAPFLLRARASANESSAIASMKAINTSEANFATTCGGGFYAVNVALLVAQRYLSPDMGFSPKSGYNIALLASATSAAGTNDCTGGPTVTAYYATAQPVTVGATGSRGFATSSNGTIWQDTTGVPPTEPFTPSADVSTIQ